MRRAACVSSTTSVRAGADLSCALAATAVIAMTANTIHFGESGVIIKILHEANFREAVRPRVIEASLRCDRSPTARRSRKVKLVPRNYSSASRSDDYGWFVYCETGAMLG